MIFTLFKTSLCETTMESTSKKKTTNTYLYYTKKDWLKINVALTFSLSILQWYRDCTHHASRDLLASWLGCV